MGKKGDGSMFYLSPKIEPSPFFLMVLFCISYMPSTGIYAPASVRWSVFFSIVVMVPVAAGWAIAVGVMKLSIREKGDGSIFLLPQR